MFSIILARPESPENIGLAARAMKNTGFKDLRLTGIRKLDDKAFKTAVHARDILENARIFPDLGSAVADLNVIFAATAKSRKNFPVMPLAEAVGKMTAAPAGEKIGLLFGNERTGLTSAEMRHSNFRFIIPQALRQPSYNLASAVLLTLFPVFAAAPTVEKQPADPPLPRAEQDAAIRRILEILKGRRFMDEKNQSHVTEMIFDLFGRLAMTDKDQRLLLAIFHKGLDGKGKETDDGR